MPKPRVDRGGRGPQTPAANRRDTASGATTDPAAGYHGFLAERSQSRHLGARARTVPEAGEALSGSEGERRRAPHKTLGAAHSREDHKVVIHQPHPVDHHQALRAPVGGGSETIDGSGATRQTAVSPGRATHAQPSGAVHTEGVTVSTALPGVALRPAGGIHRSGVSKSGSESSDSGLTPDRRSAPSAVARVEQAWLAGSRTISQGRAGLGGRSPASGSAGSEVHEAGHSRSEATPLGAASTSRPPRSPGSSSSSSSGSD